MGKLPAEELTNEDLTAHFAQVLPSVMFIGLLCLNFYLQFGSVVEVIRPVDKMRGDAPKNFCFVTFDREDPARKLVKEGSTTIKGHQVVVGRVSIFQLGFAQIVLFSRLIMQTVEGPWDAAEALVDLGWGRQWAPMGVDMWAVSVPMEGRRDLWSLLLEPILMGEAMGLQRQDIVVVASVQVRVTTLQDLRWAMPGDPLQGRFLGAHLPGEEDPGAGPIDMAKTQLSGKTFLKKEFKFVAVRSTLRI